MVKLGRPMIPMAIKKLSGTVHKERMRETNEFEQITIVPKPEVWMDDRAKKYFKNVCELLIRKKLLDVANVQLVILLAQEFSLYEEATRELKISGKVFVSDKGNLLPSPWISIRNSAQKNFRDIASLFGMDPLSSQKIGAPVQGEKDPFSEMMKKFT